MNKLDYSNYTYALVETLGAPWVETGIDIAETTIDNLLDNEVLKEIPIVKTVVATCKAGIQLRDRFLLKKTMLFVNRLNNGILTEDEISRYRERLSNDKKWAEMEAEHILVLLDATTDTRQSVRLGRFYQAYVKREIDWGKFCELAEANQRIFEIDISLLQEINDRGGMQSDYRASRLSAIGLLNVSTPSITGSVLNLDNTYYLSEFGKMFLNINRCENE